MGIKKRVDLQEAYEAWRTDPRPETMGKFVAAANPVISSMMSTIQNSSPIMKSRARALIIKSLPKYNPKRKVPIKSWLYRQLQQMHRWAVAEMSAVPLSERSRQHLAILNSTERRLKDKLGRHPSDIELAEATKFSVKKLAKIRSSGVSTNPESMFVSQETGAPELPGAFQLPREKILEDYIYHDLNPSNQKLMDMAKGGSSKADIAQALSISPSAVSQRSAKIASMFESYTMDKTAAEDASFLCLNIPEPWATRIVVWGRKRILDEELYTVPSEGGRSYGREDKIHVTLGFIKEDDSEKVRDAVKAFGAVPLSLGQVSRFRPLGEDYDVIKIAVRSPKLMKLHRLIAMKFKMTDKHPSYSPHVTIAYVKKGCCAEMVGNRPLRDGDIKVPILQFENRYNRKTPISLTEDA